jgi:predicted dehydrogenase
MPKVGYGIIGPGTIASVHAESIGVVKGAELRAVADVSKARAKKFADQYGADAYGDYRELLDRDDIQAVSICTPSGLRAEIIDDCTKAGKNVLSEKPLEVTTKRVDKIIKACDTAGVLLACIFQSRFSVDAQHIRKALDQGRFGKLVMGDAYIKWFRSQEYYDSGQWRGTWKLDGGGALMNQGIHQIDLLQWYMGPVKKLRAETALVNHKGIEVEDLAVAMLEFENGAKGVIEGSTAIYGGHPARVEVHGTEGSAIMEDGKLIHWNFAKRKPVDKKIEATLAAESDLGTGAGDPMAGMKIEGHRRQIDDFTKAILKKRAPLIDGREGRKAVHLIESIYKAARTGKTVTF